MMCGCSCMLVGLLVPFYILFTATSAVTTVSPERQHFCEFSSTQLDCYTNTTDSNDTSPTVDRVHWTFNGTIVHGVDNRSLTDDFHVGPSVDESGYKLLIVNASLNDSGRYECAVVVAGNFTETAVAFIDVVACDSPKSDQENATGGPNHVPLSVDPTDKPEVQSTSCPKDCIDAIVVGVVIFLVAVSTVGCSASGAIEKLKSRRAARFRRLIDYNRSLQRQDNEQL